VIGGSQGSQRLYQAILKALESDKILQQEFVFAIVLGLLNKDLKPYFERFSNVHIFDFVSQQEMGMLCQFADISITRGGTTSLAEQKLYDLKLIIIPITRTHDQEANAQRYQTQYGDTVLDQREE
jgi:UDP-N-acetylglucosamine:LPS N-acetylglucosamine transferase